MQNSVLQQSHMHHKHFAHCFAFIMGKKWHGLALQALSSILSLKVTYISHSYQKMCDFSDFCDLANKKCKLVTKVTEVTGVCDCDFLAESEVK